MRKIFKQSNKIVTLDEQRDKKGNLIFSRNFSDLSLSPTREMKKIEVLSPGFTFYDFQINSDSRIGGGEFWISSNNIDNVHDDDFVEMSVVDKDDVLGLFSTYNLQVGTDIIEVSEKFIKREYIKKGSKECGYHSVTTYNQVFGSIIPKGLYVRIGYNSFGETPVTILVRLELYK